jgi:hypothetical protein
MYCRKTATLVGRTTQLAHADPDTIAPASLQPDSILSPWSLGGTSEQHHCGIETNTITADKINGTSLAVVKWHVPGLTLQAATGSSLIKLTAQAVNAVSTNKYSW